MPSHTDPLRRLLEAVAASEGSRHSLPMLEIETARRLPERDFPPGTVVIDMRSVRGPRDELDLNPVLKKPAPEPS